MSKPKLAVALLTLSSIGFIGIVSQEGYTSNAVIPTKGDVPTLGFGSTVLPDGSSVKMTDTVTPARALVIAQAHINKDEQVFRESLSGAYLSQDEFDLYLDFTYQYGTANWLKSSMRKHLLDNNYPAACDALLQYKKAAGYDCSTPGNKRCWGVWERQLARHTKCVGANQ